MERIGTPELDRSYQRQLVHELTNVIREWSAIWKRKYVSNHSSFHSLEEHINNLIQLRKGISNRKILLHQLREKQKMASLAINVGNKFFKLDMVIMDEQGNMINPLRAPILRLHEYHAATAKYIHDKNTTSEYEMSIANVHHHRYNYNVYLTAKNRDETTELRYVDFVKNIGFSEMITLDDVKNDFYTVLSNGEFSKGIYLLNYLRWERSPADLLESLTVLKRLTAKGLLMFLHDVLDALFDIYKNHPYTNTLDTMVFDCLIYIIDLVCDENHLEFKPVLDLYIKENFDVEIAYSKLMPVLNNYLTDWNRTDVDYLLNVYKSLNYIMKFIVRSKSLSSE